LGAAYTLDGRAADAVGLLTQAMEQITAMERVEGQVQCHLALGEALALAGHLGEARVLAERALALARGYQERGNQAWALRLLGEIAAQHDPPKVEDAEVSYRKAVASADEVGMRPLVAHCHLGLGRLYAKLDRQEQAHVELAAAIDLYRSMDMTFWLPQAEAAMTSLRAEAG